VALLVGSWECNLLKQEQLKVTISRRHINRQLSNMNPDVSKLQPSRTIIELRDRDRPFLFRKIGAITSSRNSTMLLVDEILGM